MADENLNAINAMRPLNTPISEEERRRLWDITHRDYARAAAAARQNPTIPPPDPESYVDSYYALIGGSPAFRVPRGTLARLIQNPYKGKDTDTPMPTFLGRLGAGPGGRIL